MAMAFNPYQGIDWSKQDDASLGKYYKEYQRNQGMREGDTGYKNPDWYSGLLTEYNRRIGARTPGQYGGNSSQGPAQQVGNAQQGVDNIFDWWKNRDPVRAAGQSLPGEDEYYNRQMGNVSRILAARQRSTTSNLYDALNARGFGQSSEVARGAGQISQAYGSSLADALGNIQNNQFAARERRIENAQNQQFQSGMADKNFQYQLQLLKTQLASQGHSDLLGIIDSLISGAAQYFAPGDKNTSGGGGSYVPDPGWGNG